MTESTGSIMSGLRSLCVTVVPGGLFLLSLFGFLVLPVFPELFEYLQQPFWAACTLVACYISGELLGIIESLWTQQIRTVVRFIDRFLVRILGEGISIGNLGTQESQLYPIARQEVLLRSNLTPADVTPSDIEYLIGAFAASHSSFSQIESLVNKARMLSRLSVPFFIFALNATLNLIIKQNLASLIVAASSAAIAILLYQSAEYIRQSSRIKAFAAVVADRTPSLKQNKSSNFTKSTLSTMMD